MEFAIESPVLEEELVRQWEIPPDAERKNEVIEEILRYLAAKRNIEGPDQFRYRLCLDEALTNSITHGCPDPGQTVQVDFHWSYLSWAVRIRDDGPGFSPNDVPDPEGPDAEMRESGRGVFILERFADSVIYSRDGREVVIRMSTEKEFLE